MPIARVQSITKIADEYGLTRWEVATLIVEHGIRTYPVAKARVVAVEHWPKLERVIRRYARAKSRREKAVKTPA